MILGSVIVTAAYVLASIGTTSKVPPHLGIFLAIVLGLGLVAHLATRWLAPDANPVLLPIVTLLNGLGYVTIVTLGNTSEATTFPPDLQALWTAVGVGVYVLTLMAVKRARDLDRYRYLLLVAAVVLMLAPLLPHIGYNVAGVRLWVRVGPVTGQPVELAKILIVVFFASYFAEKREMLSIPTARLGNRLVIDPRPLGPILLAWGFCMLVLAAEKDVGFAVLVFVVFIAMLWMATGRSRYLGFGVVLFGAGVVAANKLFSQVGARVADWLHPWTRVNLLEGGSYQLVQGLYGMGSGGLIGTGLGFGQLGAIPLAGSDYIFAAFATEWGLIGAVSLIAAYALIVGAALHVAQVARSEFAKLVAAGLGLTIGFQAFFIMAGIVRLLPETGLTLPFMAYGGSSLVANYILIAILMRVSDEASRPTRTRAATARRVEAGTRLDERPLGAGNA